MRDLRDLPKTHAWRRIALNGGVGDHTSGMFIVPSPATGAELKVICSAAIPGATDPLDQWDHVSVSLRNRCPNWPEMCLIKDLFFHPHETVMQLHVPPEDWISNHPYCLHLWRPAHVDVPRPPSLMVGVKDYGDLTQKTPQERAAIGRKHGF